MNYLRSDDEQRFANFLQANLPEVVKSVPQTPRDEIWEGIQRKRLFADAEGIVLGEATASHDATELVSSGVDLNAGITSKSSALPVKRWVISMRWAAPIAAAFLIVGVGVGLLIEHERFDSHTQVAGADAGQPSNLPTQVAAEEHFAEVDQLIATFASIQGSEASEANNAQLEAEIGMWARSLLSTTQLLMDSPLGLDPQRRKLLSDVEMVLVQIAQLAPNQDPDDREITERSIEESQVRERLQDASPSPTPRKKSYDGQRGL